MSRFIPTGGSRTGNKKVSETPLGFYSIFKTATLYPATKTDKKYADNRYAIELVAKLYNWFPKLITIKYARTHSHLLSSDNVYYIKIGKIIIGKVVISFSMLSGKLKIDYIFYKKMDYRRYKVANGIRHNYQHINGHSIEYNYQVLKDRNRRRYRRLKTK